MNPTTRGQKKEKNRKKGKKFGKPMVKTKNPRGNNLKQSRKKSPKVNKKD